MIDDKVGTIAVGRQADLVVIEGKPGSKDYLTFAM
jgi:imidazolonepropionase-like amidohydrolase